MAVDPNGERHVAVFMKRGTGKSMTNGRATKERLGYIERGSVVENVHEADIAADAGRWACVTCGQQFMVQGEKAWCNNCNPRAGGRRDLSQLRPRPASERVTAATQLGQEQQRHPNFAGMQQDPWGAQRDVSPRQQPDHAQPAQPLPPPPGAVNQAQQVPPPPVPGQKKSAIKEIRDARAQKEVAFGLPVETNKLPPAPVPLATPEPRGVSEGKRYVKDVVDARYAAILQKAGVNTLYDAAKAGPDGLTKIKGIGPKMADKILAAAAE